MKKRIKIITYSNFPFGGASANYLRNMAKGLVKQGNNVEVLLPTGNIYGNINYYENKRKSTINGVNYRFLTFINRPKTILGKLLDSLLSPIFLTLYLIYFSKKKGIDIIVKYGITFSSNLLLIILSKLLSIKLVNILPEYYEKPSKNFSHTLLKWYNFYFGITKLVKYTDAIIVLTNYMKNNFPKQKHVLLVPNLIDLEFFEIHNKNKNDYFIKPKNKITIGYAGTPTKKDGVIDLLKSFRLVVKEFPNTHLLIIGDITNGKSVIPNLSKFAESLGIKQNLTFTGLVKYQNIPYLLNLCDILVLARPNGQFAEAGFPTKLGEYFSSKKAVVATAVGDLPVYFRNKNGLLLVTPEYPKDIAKGISYLISNEKKRDQIAISGYKWMLENLEYNIVSKKINIFFDNILKV